MPVVLALDLGTSFAKALRFDDDGKPVGEISRQQARIGALGRADVEDVAFAADAVVDEALASGPAPDAVAVSSAWHTLVGVDPPSKIIDSLDASLATNPGVAHDLAELEDADRKLRTLYAFMQSIATALEQGELFVRILDNLLDVFPAAEQVAVYLREPTSGMMEPRKVKRRDAAAPQLSTLPGLYHDEVVQKGRAILSAPLTPTSKHGGLSMHANSCPLKENVACLTFPAFSPPSGP